MKVMLERGLLWNTLCCISRDGMLSPVNMIPGQFYQSTTAYQETLLIYIYCLLMSSMNT